MKKKANGRRSPKPVAAPKSVGRYTTFADLPEYLSPEEYGDFLGIGRSSSYAAVKSAAANKTAHVLKIGRLIRIHRSAVAPPDAGGQK